MLQNLPIEIQLQIFREYIPIKDKYTLLKIKKFYNLITTKYSWKYPIKISLKKLHLHNTHLLDKIKPGCFIRHPRNAVFKVSINYLCASIKIIEYRSKTLGRLKRIVKKIYYPVEQVHDYIAQFYKFATPVDFKDVYETWDRYIITFNPSTCILCYNETRQFQLHPHYHDTFCSTDKGVCLLKNRNRLVIFFITKFRVLIDDMCIYLYEALNMGNEEFKYKYPFLGSCVRIVKAYSFKTSFRHVSQLHMKFYTKQNKIQLKLLCKYEDPIQMRRIFHLMEDGTDYEYANYI